MSDKSKATTFLLCYFVGIFGVHRFYLNRLWTGIAMLLTGGGLLIWWIVDSVLIAIGKMNDKEGNPLRTGPPDPADPSAGFWVRLAAISVDGVIVNAFLIALALIAMLAGIGSGGALLDAAQAPAATSGLEAAVSLLSVAVFPLYFAVLTASRHQATWGKRAFAIRVARSGGEPVGFLRALWRSLCYILSAIPLYLGFVIAAFTGRKRALHDYLAGTRVVYVDAEPAPIARAEPPPAAGPEAPVVAENPPVGAVRSGAASQARGPIVMMALGAVLLAVAAALMLA